MDFEYSPKTKALQSRLLAFMEEHVYPNEEALHTEHEGKARWTEIPSLLDASKWRTVLSVVLPTAVGGIMTGTTLAVARAGGETAPLLFVCAATTQTVVWSPNGAVSSLPFTIFSDYDQAGGAAQAWGAAFTLIVLVLVSSLTSRYFLDRSKRKLGQVS